MYLILYNIKARSLQYKLSQKPVDTNTGMSVLLKNNYLNYKYYISEKSNINSKRYINITKSRIIKNLKPLTTYVFVIETNTAEKDGFEEQYVFTTTEDLNSLCANDFEKYIYSSLNKYYKLLQQEGYVNFKETQKLIALDVIENLLYGELSNCLNSKDAQLIDKFLNKIYGSCLFPYPVSCIYESIQTQKENDGICDWVVDPIVTSFWDDKQNWKDNKIWHDEGCE